MALVYTRTASAEPVSGGGADGRIDRVVTLCLSRVVVNREDLSAYAADPEARREFDLAELIAWAGEAAGTTLVLPQRTEDLLAACRTRRTLLPDVATGLRVKGALLFGDGLGLSLGSRGRAIVHDVRSGLLVTAGGRRFSIAARLPGARGYR